LSVFDTTINSSDNANEFCNEIIGLDWSCASGCEVGCNPITNLSDVCNNCLADCSCDNVITMEVEYDGHGEDGSCCTANTDCVMDCPNVEGTMNVDEAVLCGILATWDNDECIDDCTGEVAEDVDSYILECIECLADGSCYGAGPRIKALGDECDECHAGCGNDQDCHDDCDEDYCYEGPPECALDCEGFGPEPGDDNFCEWVEGLGGIDAECLSDCDPSTIEELEELFYNACGYGGGYDEDVNSLLDRST
jgi:hypothetical protein